EKMLRFVIENSPVPVILIVEPWDKPADRLLACSLVGDVAINAALMHGAGRVLIHESDLISPPDVVQRLADVLDGDEKRAVAGGWPCLASVGMDRSLDLCDGALRLGEHLQLHLGGGPAPLPFFYDTWGYRHEGVRFTSVPPYSPCYSTEPFRLDTVGSVALIKGEYLRCGARMENEGFVGLCDRIRQLGGEIWCDPRLIINQPIELWTFQNN
ncbi:MAG: hypothetical protein EBR82_78170, partial [Caulobacteraceae bacterium]|nr:hypothetical protein [Caulobacteraceae bacterium]